MPNRMTFMERMSGRLAAIESVLKKDLLVKTGAETPQKQENATL